VIAGLALIAGGDLYLSGASAGATYAADLLPGFLAIGLGIGLVYVSVSVTAMSEIGHDQAGLASGLMTTAHEVGAALGVAVFSAVALGTGIGATAGVGFADGYGNGSLAGALIATGLAAIALVAVPAYRPVAGQRVAMH
jgi:hypothetical protein